MVTWSSQGSELNTHTQENIPKSAKIQLKLETFLGPSIFLIRELYSVFCSIDSPVFKIEVKWHNARRFTLEDHGALSCPSMLA